MNKKRTLLLIVGPLLLLTLCLAVLAQNVTASCNNEQITASQVAIITDLITELGGLPANRVDLDMADQLANETIYPVASWEISDVSVHTSRSLWQNLRDDSIHSYDITFDVEYVDGDTQQLKWTSWRYSSLVCPGLIARDNGPAGFLIPLTQK